MPLGTLESLLDDKDELTAIVAYHVVYGEFIAADVGKYKTLKSLHGSSLEIHEQHGLRHSVRINDAAAKEANLECTNGVIHTIDTVLMPK